MSRLLRLVSAFVAVVLLAGPCLAYATTAQPAKGAHAESKSKSKKGKLAEPEPPPPRPRTPEQLPPARPVVSYLGGRLSIVANNSTLADVLDAVRRQTGAAIEMSGVAPSDRVYVKLGPGAPKDVLAALLEGSRFNYAILGSDTDPDAVRRVVLLPKAGAAAPFAGSAGPLSPQLPAARSAAPPPPDDEDIPPAEEGPGPAVEEQQPEPQNPSPGQPNQPGQVKTPEQLLQELQQMQQQQQQQQNPQQSPQQSPNPQDPQ